MKIVNKINNFIILLFIIFLYVCPTYAKNNISKISFDIMLKVDGSATITELWNGTFDEGSELTVPLDHYGHIINNFYVDNENGSFNQVYDWDKLKTLNDKAYKYSIYKKDKKDVFVFGIGQYGENTYTIRYDVQNFVKSFNVEDGFIYEFLPKDMVTYPTLVVYRVRTEEDSAFNPDFVEFETLGFESNDIFENDMINGFSATELKSQDYMTIKCKLSKGIVSPMETKKNSFDEYVNQYLQKKTDKNLSVITILIITIITVIIGNTILSLISKFRVRS